MKKDVSKMIPVYVMGKKYMVPQGLTILKALEYSGYKLTRGCGCRGGVCGACATVYRKKGDYRLRFGLACQTVVEPDTYLVQLPYISANKAIYSIKNTVPDELNIIKLYPELMRCMGCNACTNSCPMDIEVMNYVAAAIRGNLKEVVELSMECVMCGLCAARCPAELSPFNIALLIRRLYGKHVVPSSLQFKKRLDEIKNAKFSKELDDLKRMDRAEVEEKYKKLQTNKGPAV
jgi:heterodisulfide reductase subunit C